MYETVLLCLHSVIHVHTCIYNVHVHVLYVYMCMYIYMYIGGFIFYFKKAHIPFYALPDSVSLTPMLGRCSFPCFMLIPLLYTCTARIIHVHVRNSISEFRPFSMTTEIDSPNACTDNAHVQLISCSLHFISTYACTFACKPLTSSVVGI